MRQLADMPPLRHAANMLKIANDFDLIALLALVFE